ncbi:hypothetical protein FNV43_RR26398 [Rhamnella rubrinervis]|uniref:Uncharacterized protein n=1 Tax=Rhamnella rubrinervis TaxID=2594499 RepID=A0A8K0GNR0_9ROSA|nr:hypothetical protein FNV43_RR26398 [Rhamnella rubrinervis]
MALPIQTLGDKRQVYDLEGKIDTRASSSTRPKGMNSKCSPEASIPVWLVRNLSGKSTSGSGQNWDLYAVSTHSQIGECPFGRYTHRRYCLPLLRVVLLEVLVGIAAMFL